jgi:hypothetical protein
MENGWVRHILVTGACGAGKSTLGRALAQQLGMPLHRLDGDPVWREMIRYEPDLHRFAEPGRYAEWQALRRHLVAEAIKLPVVHVIEGTQILAAPEWTAGHRCILVDTPLGQIVRQMLARERANYAANPERYADVNPGRPGSGAARRRARRVRGIYEGLRPEIEVFRQLPGVEIVPSRAFKQWLWLNQAKEGRRM